MKYLIGGLLAIYIALVLLPFALSQSPIPFASWPALHAAAENLVVKRGITESGQPNDSIYLRIGWGPCLIIRDEEWPEFFHALHTDQYINMRDYADSQFEFEGHRPDDSYNCPAAPKEVKPTWRNSRPVYELVETDISLWQRGPKTEYRVQADASLPLPECAQFAAKKDDGTPTNYRILQADVELTARDGSTVNVGDLPGWYVSVCRDQDVDPIEHRWTVAGVTQ